MTNRKLGRKIGHRRSMLKNLAISLFIYEKITTSEAKAKEIRPLAEKAITVAKKGDLNARRRLLSMFLHNKNVVNKLVDDIAKRFSDTNSGFIRMFKTKPRLGDNSPQIILIISKSKFLNNIEDKKIQTIKKSK